MSVNEQSESFRKKLKAQLIHAAKIAIPVTYRDLAQAIGIRPPGSIHQLTELLEELMANDAAADRPFLAALVVSKTGKALPARGFFEYARKLGRSDTNLSETEAATFYLAELSAAISYWRQIELKSMDADLFDD